MSTRASIIVCDQTGKRQYIYHHHDGYLDGVGQELKDFLETYTKSPDSTWDCSDITMKILALDDEYEITTNVHGDIEYKYTISTDRAAITLTAEDCSTGSVIPGFTTIWKRDIKTDAVSFIICQALSDYFKTQAAHDLISSEIMKYFGADD